MSEVIVSDPVNHPDHYRGRSVEAIQVIEEFTQGLDGIEAVCTGNCLKYLMRWHRKNGIEDLKKCRWYLNYLIGNMEKLEQWKQ